MDLASPWACARQSRAEQNRVFCSNPMIALLQPRAWCGAPSNIDELRCKNRKSVLQRSFFFVCSYPRFAAALCGAQQRNVRGNRGMPDRHGTGVFSDDHATASLSGGMGAGKGRLVKSPFGRLRLRRKQPQTHSFCGILRYQTQKAARLPAFSVSSPTKISAFAVQSSFATMIFRPDDAIKTGKS